MAINKKLIHFLTLENFNTQLSAGNILDTSICFIKDAKKIWTHGEFYDCSESETIDTSTLMQLGANTTDQVVSLDADTITFNATENTVNIDGTTGVNITTNYDGNINVKTGSIGDVNVGATEGNVNITASDAVNIDAGGTLIITADTDNKGISIGTDIEVNANSGNVALNGSSVLVNGNDITTIPVYRLTITPTLSDTANAGTYQYSITSCTIDSDSAANVYEKLVACANSGTPVYVSYGSVTWRWFMGSCQIPASGQVLLEYWVPSGMHCQIIFTSSGFRNGNCWYFRKHLTTPVVTQTSASVAIAPNVYNIWSGTYSSLTITLTTASDSTIVNEYMAQFTTSSSGCTLTLPSTLKWANGETPTIEASKTYQLSIINNLAVIASFS